MDFYWIKTNRLIKWLFPKYAWDLPNDSNTVYLTFDDGPIPEITPWVLDVLRSHNIRATFFCIGHNIEKHPDLYRQIVSDGHATGNHTFNHLNGWKTDDRTYLDNIRMCADTARKHSAMPLRLFRPPYGKITLRQANKVLGSGYKIIMWDVLAADYDRSISPQKCLENATEKVAAGSIIVFHDSIKAFRNLEYALPETIRVLKEKGFKFAAID